MSEVCLLIVESDVLVRHPLAEYLRECGYRVLEAATTTEARKLLDDDGRSVGVVLADVDTPEEGGFALAAWIRRTDPAIEVVLTGSPARAAQKAGDLCEDGPALTKPYDHRRVLDHIRRLQAARERGG